ncbi:hypothetical protein [Variovorax sp. Varisp62]|uniref:hypothetical protein n=1 Tax=Variovorax sp. Varisp62 TaxID=3243049 RepID=UPI0039B5160B
MLKFSEAAEMRDRVVKAEGDLSASRDELVQQCTQLHTLRSEVGRTLVADVEAYVNTLARHPKTYDRTFELYHLHLQQFDDSSQMFSEGFSQDIRDAATVGSATAGLGAAAGAATAFGAPTAALAIATTFGTASTGTAISALTGAAATNAALAWLGGGTLAVGGGGMAAGNALLAMAGPVGIALAGTSLIAGVGWAAYKNRCTIEEATERLQQLSETHAAVQRQSMEVSGLYALTVEHTHKLRQLLSDFAADASKDYLAFTDRQKELLGAMHNNVLALTRLLKLKPGEMADLTEPVEESELAAARDGIVKEAYTPNFVMHPAAEPTGNALNSLASAAGPLASLKRMFA